MKCFRSCVALFGIILSPPALAAVTFAELKESSISASKCISQKLRDGIVEEGVYRRVTDTSSPLDQRSAGRILRRAEAAVGASVEDAQAGVRIAPLGLVGKDTTPFNFTVTIAALEEERTRLGAALNLTLGGPDLSFSGVGLKACDFDKDADTQVRQQLDALQAPFSAVCQSLIAGLPDPLAGGQPAQSEIAPDEWERAQEIWRGAQHVCGIPGSTRVSFPADERSCARDFTVELAIPYVRKAIDFEERRLEDLRTTALDEASRQATSGALAALRASRQPLDADLQTLKRHRDWVPTQCLSDAALRDKVRQAAWRSTRWTVGVDGSVDAFPFRKGFSPDDEPLPSGEIAAWRLNLAAAVAWKRLEVALGATATRSRTKFEDDLRGTLGPTLGIAYVIETLSSQPLVNGEGDIQLLEGELPPRVLIGFDAAVDFGLNRLATQPKRVSSGRAALFLDFRFTEKLVVRVGIPVKAETVVREAKPADGETPAVTELRDLQYSLPVFVLTTLKL